MHNRLHAFNWEIHELTEALKADGVVDGAVGEEIGAQAFLFDFLLKHRFHVDGFEEEVPHLLRMANC